MSSFTTCSETFRTCACRHNILSSGLLAVNNKATSTNELLQPGVINSAFPRPVALFARAPAPKIPPGFEHLSFLVLAPILPAKSKKNRVMAINDLLELKVSTNTVSARPVSRGPAFTIPLPEGAPNVSAKDGSVFRFGSNIILAPADVNQPSCKSQESYNSKLRYEIRNGEASPVSVSTTRNSLSQKLNVCYTPTSEGSDDNDWNFFDDNLPELTEEDDLVVTPVEGSPQSPVINRSTANYVPTAQNLSPIPPRPILTVIFDAEGIPTLITHD